MPSTPSCRVTVRSVRPARRAAAWLLPLALLLAGPALHAGDPSAKAFRKAARAEFKALRATGKSAFKQVRNDLRDAAKAYAKSEQGAGEAVAAAVDALTTARASLELAALAAAQDAAQAGAEILSGAAEGSLDPGPDFLAGGRGTWDAHLADIDAELDKLDRKLSKQLVRFMSRMAKGAKKRDESFALHARLPPHGEGHHAVLPPGTAATDAAAPEGDDELAPERATQILIAARFVAVDHSDTLELGVTFDGGADETLDVVVEGNTGGMAVPEQIATLGADTARVSVPMLGTLIDAESAFARISLVLDATKSNRSSVLLSIPRVIASAPTDKPARKALIQAAKPELKQFGKVTGQIVSALGKQLKSHVKALKMGFVGGHTALSTGFCDLSDARRDVGIWRQATIAATLKEVQSDLDELGIDSDFDLPPDLAQDNCGLYAKLTEQWQRREAQRQRKATRIFERFAEKVLKIAGKQGELLGGGWVVGRTVPVGLPMITTGADLAGFPRSLRARLTDAYVLVEGANAGPEAEAQVSVELAAQADPAVTLTPVSTHVSVHDGTVVIAGLVTGPAGAGKADVPALSDIPLVGRLFRTRDADDDQHRTIILVTPRVLGAVDD